MAPLAPGAKRGSMGNTIQKSDSAFLSFLERLRESGVKDKENDGQFGAAYRQKVQSELLGSEPRRSLKAWPNPDKLKPEDPRYAKELAAWALSNTRLGLLPFQEQLEVFKKFGIEESAVKA